MKWSIYVLQVVIYLSIHTSYHVARPVLPSFGFPVFSSHVSCGYQNNTGTPKSKRRAVLQASLLYKVLIYSFLCSQFRLTNGSTMTGSFQATDILSTVTDYVSSNRTDGSTPFALMTSFPRKTFSAADMNKTVKDAGLVPSAVLILTKL